MSLEAIESETKAKVKEWLYQVAWACEDPGTALEAANLLLEWADSYKQEHCHAE